MVTRRHEVDDSLLDWPEVKARANWSGLLIGNGASRAVWDRFAYRSLYEEACDAGIAHPLTDPDKEFFRVAGDSGNFEAVLSALATARTVCGILGQDTALIQSRYSSIRQALVEAVHAVHIPWRLMPQNALLQIRRALLEFDYVYSTNYDLITYWAMMAENDDGFRDYFWGPRFDLADTEIWRKSTKVMYLHGALHLYRGEDGATYKDRADGYENLLDRFGTHNDWVPLFVSEGSARSKMRSIMGSDYLSFCFQQFGRHRGPLVVFGHGLSDVDEHIIDAVRRWSDPTIAYGMLNFGSADVIEQKARVVGKLPNANLFFFDASTHPLGDASLKVAEP